MSRGTAGERAPMITASDMLAMDARQDAVVKRAQSIIDSRLATLEVILNKTLDVVHRGREKLQGFEEKHLLSELAE